MDVLAEQMMTICIGGNAITSRGQSSYLSFYKTAWCDKSILLHNALSESENLTN